jgi:hypothetical protein
MVSLPKTAINTAPVTRTQPIAPASDCMSGMMTKAPP